ncbi:MAG TPA: DNA polymerase III subunit gamma/tau [Candidatus Cloacimonadota bacterium]|nr:DNA polymerase III subunit gamma/tau [Candidatus Cloacimonadota bacterium]
MSYLVLARKYRPQTFKEVYSQEHITQILANAIKSNRIAHAYLFTGPRGVGKTSMARILAKSLNCINGPTITPCGVCHNCVEIATSVSPDVIEIDGASNTGVDDVRELQKELIYAPSSSKYKIYIIDEVHMLSKNAFNALLKTLEEPPENVIFIFATTEPQKVIPTIISRCQRYDFRRIPPDDIVANLKHIAAMENIKIDEESLYLIARKSDGGMRDALSLLDQVLTYGEGDININIVRKIFSEVALVVHANLLQAMHEHEGKEVISQFQQIVNQGVDLVEFLNSFMEFLRQVLLIKVGFAPRGIMKEDLEIIRGCANNFELNTLMYMMTLFIQLKQDLRTASHPSILIEVTLLKMSRLDEMEDLEKILAKLQKSPAKNIQQQVPAKQVSAPTKKTQPLPEREVEEPVEEIEYVPPQKVAELTKEHVLENWPGFLNHIGKKRSALVIALKNGKIVSVKSNMIFIDFDSSLSYNMISKSQKDLEELLSEYFNLPVKVITNLTETSIVNDTHTPTLQEIKQNNPALAQLIELTNAVITSSEEPKRK